MSVSYELYHTFYYVGKYQSFTKAAEFLGKNQPNITRSMNRLEEDLDCKLLNRTNRGISLTEEGQLLFEHISNAFEQITLGERKLSEAKNLQKGQISIGYSIGANDLLLYNELLPVLQNYQQLYPKIHIRFLSQSTPNAISSVRDGLIDFAIITSTKLPNDIEEHTIKSFQDILIAGQKYSYLYGQSLSIKELKKYPLVGLSQNTETFQFYSQFFANHHLSFEPDIEVPTATQIFPFVIKNFGLGFVNSEYAIEVLGYGDVFQIPLKETIPLRHISLIHHKTKPLSRPASVLLNLLHTTSGNRIS
ncbi:MAG: LysR family transcriptional regulator [Lachnospiraceae bacterium]|nr:LysR family transcriptional regulator [Lachnospiraceae bacterium]